MIRMSTLFAALGLAALSLHSTQPGHAQARPGIERLYILDCGVGVAGDISRWSPGVNVGQSMGFVDTCYLIRHAQGWLLWDTGVADAIAAMPDGQRPADPRATHWRRPKTLAGELDQLGLKPADIRYVAISHTHADHTGNLAQFPHSVVLVQKAEVDASEPLARTLQAMAARVETLAGDHDVFGDGSVTLISTPGHTPGHQSLLVRLPNTGALLLSGDAVHFTANWENRRVPANNFDKERTVQSMQRMAEIVAQQNAQLWINHDKAQRDSLKMAPAWYD